MISLLFNHALVEGVAYRASGDTGQAATALLRAVDHARKLWPEAQFYVHDQLWNAQAAPDLPFRVWASRNAANPELRDCVRQLLQVCDRGPFLSSLIRDDLGPPQNIIPLPEDASDTVFDVLEQGLHHQLAFPEAHTWLISFGNGALALPHPNYEGHRDGERSSLANLRDTEEAHQQFEDVVATELGSRQAVLDRVLAVAPRVRFLDRVAKGIQGAHIDIPLPRLFRALVGLGVFAAAQERGAPPASAYEEATGIEVSDESATFYQQPNRRRQVEFLVPGETARTVFGWHAKVGHSTRIHFTWRRGTYQGPQGPVEGPIIWVGRIDRHPG